jgi:nucleoside-diphosphate-sugar epimerase
MRALIVGCGYVGVPLGAELVRRGHEVWGIRRTESGAQELKGAGIRPLVLDLLKLEELNGIPGPFDWVVNLVSAGQGGVEAYRQVYFQGTRNLLEYFGKQPPRRLVYTSSTGVYSQTDGSAVKEDHETLANTETNQVLIDTEKLLLEAHQSTRFPAIILRVAGIYGPGRCHYLRQFVNNAVKIERHGQRHLNMIHRDDLLGVIIAALESGRGGNVYNAVDFFRWLAETLGKWMPPYETPEEMAARQRGWSNKKVLNRKLKMELGYQFKHATFREGYTVEIRRLEDAGELDITPDPR